MAMKKATRDRVTAAYDRGFVDGEASGFEQAEAKSTVRDNAERYKKRNRLVFTDSLDKEADPE